MAPSKKSKKGSDNINSRLALVMKSGKVTLGVQSTMKTLRSGKAKLVIIAANTPPFASPSSSTMPCWLRLLFTISLETTDLQIELGTACGKLFRCSTMAILDAGDSDILTGTQ
ncbi:60S ribosomal protein L10-A [Penicillium diatomitis]|uniref:60S ribosomal protein L10-A n=1 Tax=Penicillium diatomitis TaxID=2819901 RepID=A0A9X0BUW7_9EURO|nr:60S ribosomal protein L10-A [Penicillium diatomitis]KAJ5485609.1 60S ribosomal protein L10-A [Penicillium diatomitis]